MRHIILGSGLIGLLAEEIIGNCQIMPYGRSRYYSLHAPLADDFIPCVDMAASILDNVAGLSVPIAYKRAFSVNGALFSDASHDLVSAYLKKVYGNRMPTLAEALLKMNFFVYGLTCRQLYRALLDKYKDKILVSVSRYGNPKSIKDNAVICDRGAIEYDRIVSTIPLNKLLPLVDEETQLDARSVYYYYVMTDDLDLEGADQVLVVDENIDFFRVDKIGPCNYVFWSLSKIETPKEYFSAFMNRFAVGNWTSIQEAIPLAGPGGMPPILDGLKTRHKIECVGSNAQWDDLMDVGGCIRRLVRIRDAS